MQRCILEIVAIGGNELPARYFLSQYGNRSHVGEIPPQAIVILVGSGEPDAVIVGRGRFVTEDQDDFFSDVNGQASEHWICARRERCESLENEFMWDRLAFDGERVGQRDEHWLIVGSRHA